MSHTREVSCSIISEAIRKLFIEANEYLEDDVLSAIEKSILIEESDLGRYALERIVENAKIAKEKSVPICQDTGIAIVFVELGQDVHVTEGSFQEAIQKGVREAYQDGFLRKSVCDPLSRQNTGDNTPAIIYTEIVNGNRIRISAMPKGGGSENMSSCSMLLPADGIDGIKEYVVTTVENAGPNPCPPVIVGVGIGGSLEKVAILSKKALLRPIGEPNKEDRSSRLENELLAEINSLGIGPQGYGGKVTALAVHVEMMPCHIASLPVAVTIQCHVARHKTVVI